MSRARPCAVLGAIALALAPMTAMTAHAQPPPVSPDDFVAAAAGSDRYEIMAARVALTESHDAAIRTFAATMIQEHEASTAALRQAAMRSGLKPPSDSMGGEQAMLLAALQGVRGHDFDRAYGRQQRLAHRQALATMRGYARSGSDPNLRAVAEADVPMIERHLSVAQSLPE